ncbi:hypothetical protein UM89_13840 [Bacillus subtilis]|nr:hypothetical protein UM89_13840 [Bacillus subtilis]
MLNEVLVPVPPKQEHDRLMELVKDMLSSHDKASELLVLENNIDSLRQSLLFKALRGELGTNDPSEESALELLKEVLQQ